MQEVVMSKAYAVGANFHGAPLPPAIPWTLCPRPGAARVLWPLPTARVPPPPSQAAPARRGSGASSALSGRCRAAGADMTNSVVDRVAFDNSDLSGVKFHNAVITGATFSGANLAGATFDDALIGGEDAKRLCAPAGAFSPASALNPEPLRPRLGLASLRLIDID